MPLVKAALALIEHGVAQKRSQTEPAAMSRSDADVSSSYLASDFTDALLSFERGVAREFAPLGGNGIAMVLYFGIASGRRFVGYMCSTRYRHRCTARFCGGFLFWSAHRGRSIEATWWQL